MVVSQQAGGGEAVAPVAAMLLSKGLCQLTVVIHPSSERAFRALRVPVDQVVTWNAAADADAAESLLRKENPALVLTSAGGGDSLDRLFIYVARRRGIPTLTLLDFWNNYRTRIENHAVPHTSEQSDGESLDFLPDFVAVMDEHARMEMVAAGFPENRLVVTGHPRFDTLTNWVDRDWRAERKYWAEQYQINHDDLWILFLSQPVGALYNSGGHQSSNLPYNEHTLLAELISCLEEDDIVPGRKNVLLVRYHPRQDVVSSDDLQRNSRIQIRLAQAPDPQEVLAVSDLVVGINTVLLADAFLMGRPVASLQLGLDGEDQFEFGGMSGIPKVVEATEIRTELRNALASAPHRNLGSSEKSLLDGCATERVVALAQDLIGKY